VVEAQSTQQPYTGSLADQPGLPALRNRRNMSIPILLPRNVANPVENPLPRNVVAKVFACEAEIPGTTREPKAQILQAHDDGYHFVGEGQVGVAWLADCVELKGEVMRSIKNKLG